MKGVKPIAVENKELEENNRHIQYENSKILGDILYIESILDDYIRQFKDIISEYETVLTSTCKVFKSKKSFTPEYQK